MERSQQVMHPRRNSLRNSFSLHYSEYRKHQNRKNRLPRSSNITPPPDSKIADTFSSPLPMKSGYNIFSPAPPTKSGFNAVSPAMNIQTGSSFHSDSFSPFPLSDTSSNPSSSKENELGDFDEHDSSEDNKDLVMMEICKRKQNRFTIAQTFKLVDLWVEYSKTRKLQSKDGRLYWQKIQEAVNKEMGTYKTVTNIKKKMHTLKKAYKDTIHNNSKYGKVKQSCKFFEELDSVMGKCNVILMPAAITSGNPNADEDKNNERCGNDAATSNLDPENKPSENDPAASILGPEYVIKKPQFDEKDLKKMKGEKCDSVESMNKTLLELQEKQEGVLLRLFDRLEAMEEKAHERNIQFMLKLTEILTKNQ